MRFKFLIAAVLFAAIGYGGIHAGWLGPVTAAHAEARLRSVAASALEGADIDWARVTMDGQMAILSGMAPDTDATEAAAETVRRAVWAGGLVAGGITQVDTSRVTYPAMRDAAAPVATPFTWSATLADDGSLQLVGFVPGERARLALIAEAENLFNRPVVDRMQLARGAPEDDWLSAARLSLTTLSHLRQGTVSAVDADFSITGMAKTDAARLRAEEPLSAWPNGLTVKTTIGYFSEAEADPAMASDTPQAREQATP